MLYNKLNFDVWKVADKDDTRRNLNCVRFEPDKTVATDGHRLIMMSTVKDMSLDDYPTIPNSQDIMLDDGDPYYSDFNGGVSLPRDSVKDFKFLKQGKNSYPILDYAVLSRNGSDKVVINQTDLETTKQADCRIVDADFPDYQQVIPTGKPIVQFTVNASYLSELCQIMAGLNKKIPSVTLSVWDDLSPIRIDATNHEQSAMALLMPMRDKDRIKRVNPFGIVGVDSNNNCDPWEWSVNTGSVYNMDGEQIA